MERGICSNTAPLKEERTAGSQRLLRTLSGERALRNPREGGYDSQSRQLQREMISKPGKSLLPVPMWKFHPC